MFFLRSHKQFKKKIQQATYSSTKKFSVGVEEQNKNKKPLPKMLRCGSAKCV